MAYPTSIFDGCSDGLFYCYASWLNTVTQGTFWSMFIVAFMVSLFMAAYRYGTPRAFGFASFGAGILSFYLLFIGLVAWWFASIFFISMILGLVIMKMMP